MTKEERIKKVAETTQKAIYAWVEFKGAKL